MDFRHLIRNYWWISAIGAAFLLVTAIWIALGPEDIKARSRTPTNKTVTQTVPAQDLRRLEAALNSRDHKERAKAYAPGLIRNVFEAAAAKKLPSGKVNIRNETLKWLSQNTASVIVELPKGKSKTLLLTREADGQWYFTLLKEGS